MYGEYLILKRTNILGRIVTEEEKFLFLPIVWYKIRGRPT
jgi:hypothetical protein